MASGLGVSALSVGAIAIRIAIKVGWEWGWYSNSGIIGWMCEPWQNRRFSIVGERCDFSNSMEALPFVFATTSPTSTTSDRDASYGWCSLIIIKTNMNSLHH
jgi:hypothetical protein